MKLRALRLVNFRQHADSSLTFGDGLTGIIGPNGSGKTTVLEAIAWALYGQQAARGTRDSLRYSRAPARASVRVELEFDLAGHRYRVVRGLTSAELYLDNGPAPVANSITGVTELLQRRLGMTKGEFFNTYFTGQKELSVMAAMGPTERAQFLSRVLGYERLRAAQTLVRERRKLVVAELQGLRAGLPDPDAVRAALRDGEARVAAARAEAERAEQARVTAQERLAGVVPRWQAVQEARERALALAGELRVAEAEGATLAREGERLARELDAATAAGAEVERLSSLLAPLPILRTELARLDQLAAAEGRRQALLESERALVDEAARLAERRAKLAAAPALERETEAQLAARRAEFDAAQGEHEAQRTAYVRDRQEVDTKLEALRAQFDDVKAQRERVEQLGPESPCPTCTRPLGDNFGKVLDGLEDQLDTLRANGKYFRDRAKQLEAEPDALKTLGERRRALAAEVTALERRFAKCQAGVQELRVVEQDVAARERRLSGVRGDLAALPAGYDHAAHRAMKAEAERLTQLDRERVRAEATVARAAVARAALDHATDALARVRARVDALRARAAATPFDEARFAEGRSEHDEAVAAARVAELRAAQTGGELAAARAALEGAERQRAELERGRERLEALTQERVLHEELDRAYTDLRTDLNMQLRPELSDAASRFLEELTDGRYDALDIDEQYNVVVLEEKVPKPVISGGEEDLANLVLRLAISQMIAERAGQSFSLLVLDEVFGSLDESRRANVIELLRRLHDRFEQVIVITHIEDVREGLDQVIRVRYDEARGASVVEQDDRAEAGGESAARPARPALAAA
ncbi:hypothetical protein tb265_03010 [Gemmatimonadetes bacterium T265]|nr:hypothetical protein tb265_03010 [Gemmatimonadetes bacterium T265]